MNRRLSVTVGTLALLVSLTGCGDDGADDKAADADNPAAETSGTGGDDAEPTNEDFLATANELCTSAQVRYDEVKKRLPTDSAMDFTILDKFFGAYRRMLDELAALEPPAELADQFQEMLTAARVAIDDLDKKFFDADPKLAEAARKLVEDLGLSACTLTP